MGKRMAGKCGLSAYHFQKGAAKTDCAIVNLNKNPKLATRICAADHERQETVHIT